MTSVATTENCALVIIGAGYAGLNALNAATKYVPKGSTVVVVDAGRAWGGQWPDQYDFVRLHQPHVSYTAGEREWSITHEKGRDYLARKHEILQHFNDIVLKVVEEKKLRLITLFKYRYEDHLIVGDKVHLTAQPTLDGALPVKIVATRMIKALGAQVLTKRPFNFNTSRVHSLTAADCCLPAANAQMMYSADADKPIYIIGSGKTAMDTIIALRNLGPGVRDRIRCVSGRGTFFLVREKLSTHTGPMMVEMMSRWDRTNGREIMLDLLQRGLLHSPFEDPGTCVWAIASGWEVAAMNETLSPMAEKVIRAHLLDIIPSSETETETDTGTGTGTGEGHMQMKVRMLNGGGTESISIPTGSFIVNCTDNLSPSVGHDPIVDDSGLVLAPQSLCGFPGQSAHLATHAWHLQPREFDKLWRAVPMSGLYEYENKINFGFYLSYGLIIVTAQLAALLPNSITSTSRQLSNGRPDSEDGPTAEEMGKQAQMLQPMVEKFSALITDRYVDKAPPVPYGGDIGKDVVYGGNIAAASRL